MKNKMNRFKPITYVTLVLIFSWWIVYLFRPNTVPVHLYYFPIVLGAWYWKKSGGIIVGIISGILAGPLMLLDYSENINQSSIAQMVRLGFFVTLGAFAGFLFSKIRNSADQLLLQEKTIELQRQLAITDGLTNIYNRRHFDEILDKEYMRKTRYNTSLSLILFDIDHFKIYNDTYGHPKGDECLKMVAKAVQATLKRPADFFARYGGEEFVLILPNTDQNGAKKIAESIRKNIEALSIPTVHSSTNPFITVSLGIDTLLPSSDIKPSQLLKRVDRALYSAKEKGRNNAKAYNEI